MIWRKGWIHPILQNRPRVYHCLLFFLYPSSIRTVCANIREKNSKNKSQKFDLEMSNFNEYVLNVSYLFFLYRCSICKAVLLIVVFILFCKISHISTKFFQNNYYFFICTNLPSKNTCKKESPNLRFFEFFILSSQHVQNWFWFILNLTRHSLCAGFEEKKNLN